MVKLIQNAYDIFRFNWEWDLGVLIGIDSDYNYQPYSYSEHWTPAVSLALVHYQSNLGCIYQIQTGILWLTDKAILSDFEKWECYN